MLHHLDGPRILSEEPSAGAAKTPRAEPSDVDWGENSPPLPLSVMMAAVKDLGLISRLSQHLHNPRTPTWDCRSCSEPWPCAQARQELVLDLGWVRVSIYLAVMMERAAGDLQGVYPHQLWNRFIEWTYPIHGIHDPRLLNPSQ